MPKITNRCGPAPEILAGRIKAERERLGLTKTEAARRLGVARESYAQLEVAANPHLSMVFSLVEMIGMEARALLPELCGRGPKRAG